MPLQRGARCGGSVRSAIEILVGGNLGEIGVTVVSSLFSRRAPIDAPRSSAIRRFVRWRQRRVRPQRGAWPGCPAPPDGRARAA